MVVFEPYAGYMHLVPRLAIAFCALFPIEVIPVVVTVVAAFVVSLTAAACFLFLETRIRSMLLRFTAWAVILVTPNAGGEVTNNLANLHWFLMVGAVCALLVRAPNRWFAAVQCAVVVAAVGSDPLVLMFVPLVVVRLVLLKSRRDRSIAVAFILTAAVQLSVTFVGIFVNESRSFARTIPPVPDLLDFYTFRVVLSGIAGVTATERYGEALGATIPGLITASVLAFLIVAVRRNRPARYALIVAAGSSATFFAIVFALQWNTLGPLGALDLQAGQRYALLPTMLLLIAIILAADALIQGQRQRVVIALSVAVALVVLVPSVADYRWVNLRAGAASWEQSLEVAGEACNTGSASKVTIPVAPGWFTGAEVPCDLLDDEVGQ
ncbi:hypothetical protein [Microbacterium sp. P05]|uniref:hypothetical protein n=1 Tax=Microbacterium sp. P05 TaxID=3366948 RepID=UPI0037456B5A